MAGQNPSMVIRVAATIAELKANLAEGKSQIETTTASMAKMAASLSGEKLIQSAHNITAAVNQIGGASKLTDAEAARVNATLTRALEKYAALGKEAPAAMVALAEATKRVEAPTEGLSAKMVAVGTAIGTMAANALMALGRLALDGVRALASSIVDLVADGAKLAGLEQSFSALTASLGETSAVMLGAMRTGTRGLVADLDLMQAANKAVLLGLPVTSKELGDLAQTATVLGRAMGLTATTAFNDLITALGRSSPMILDNLGLTVKVGEANEAYAASLGKTAAQLTDAEKKTAFFNAAMEAARAKVASLGEAQLTLGERIQTAGVWWTNFRNDLSIGIARSTVLGAGLEALGNSIAAAFGGQSQSLVAAITAGVNKFAMFVVDAGMFLVEFGRTGVQVFNALMVPQKAVTAAMVYLVERFAAGIAVMAELAAKLPGVGGAFEGVAASARLAADTWGAMRVQASGALASSLELATGQGVVHGALDKVSSALVNMKAAMVAASMAQDVQITTGIQHAAVLESASFAAVKYAAAVDQVVPAIEAATAADEVYRSGLTFTTETVATLAKEVEHLAAVQASAAEAEAARRSARAANLSASGSFALADISIEQAIAGGGAARLKALEELFRLFPGRRPGGSGATGVGASDAAGWAQMQREQLEYLQLKKALASGVSGFANGVKNFSGGFAMVGERGPELVHLPRGSDVIPNSQLGGGSNITIAPVLHFHGPVLGSSLEFDAAVSGALLNVLKSGAISIPAGVG